ncbi:MAG: hypothetical protein ACOY3I_05650 [Verrucomicrobiota bacterium]
MNAENYNPFWVCLAVFIGLLVTAIFQTNNLFEQRKLVQNAQKNTTQLKDKYNAAQRRVEALVKDLVELAKINSAAQKIVAEFNIKVDASAAPSASASQPAPATFKPSPAKK